MADPNLSEIVTTTLRNRSKEFADNVSNGNALLQHLEKRGNIKNANGGRTIVQEVDYAENSTFMYYNGYEQLDISPSVVLSAAEFAWKQAATVVSWSGLEIDVQNSGPHQVADLLDARIRNSERTFANQISTGIYSDGTGTGGKQIGGLQLLVADAPTTGTVGGINRANFSFWQNKTYDFSSASVTVSAGTFQIGMRKLWLRCLRGNDKTTFITSDETYYEFFWDSLTDIQRITKSDRGDSGFEELAFKNVPVVYDGDSGHPSSHMYFLNTDYIFWRPHPKRNMVPLDRRMSVNQDATVLPVVFAGNMTASNCARQGVLKA